VESEPTSRIVLAARRRPDTVPSIAELLASSPPHDLGVLSAPPPPHARTTTIAAVRPRTAPAQSKCMLAAPIQTRAQSLLQNSNVDAKETARTIVDDGPEFSGCERGGVFSGGGTRAEIAWDA